LDLKDEENSVKFDLEDTIALLSHTPAALNALLRDLPEAWTSKNEGDGTMTACDVIGHLLFLEGHNWIQRAEFIMRSDESRVFPPVDRAGRGGSEDKSLPNLLDEFAHARSTNLDALRALNLTQSDLARRALHPTFGPVTLSQLLATWVTHDMTHLHQLSRILAHQYREAVGPWIKFLGVLKCEGHSEPA
jgi:DinB superfamily